MLVVMMKKLIPLCRFVIKSEHKVAFTASCQFAIEVPCRQDFSSGDVSEAETFRSSILTVVVFGPVLHHQRIGLPALLHFVLTRSALVRPLPRSSYRDIS